MMLWDLRRCRMTDAVLALLRWRAAALACLLHGFHCNAAAYASAVAQCLQGCALLAPQWCFEVSEALQCSCLGVRQYTCTSAIVSNCTPVLVNGRASRHKKAKNQAHRACKNARIDCVQAFRCLLEGVSVRRTDLRLLASVLQAASLLAARRAICCGRNGRAVLRSLNRRTRRYRCRVSRCCATAAGAQLSFSEAKLLEGRRRGATRPRTDPST